MMSRHGFLGSAAAAALLLGAAGAASAQEAAIAEAIAGGKLIFETRGRYEQVDQANFSTTAQALTLRTRLGWETGAWNNVKGLIEFEDIRRLGPARYNTTLNGKTAFPTVADPEVTELNRLQLAWTPNADALVVVGRQRINIDDQRFIGAAGWRQDEQTFDAVRLDGGMGRLKATYAYLGKINRTVAQAADWTSKSHVLNATYAFDEAFKAQGFVYALDFKQSPALSSITSGVRVSGGTWLSLYKLSYAAAYAEQRNYGANPGRYRLPYWTAELAGTYDIFTPKVNYESLAGDGTRGFATPLATLHAFQGWADAFTATPARGVNDLNISLTASPRMKWDYLYNLQFVVRRHDFRFQKGGGSLGSEWDASAQAAITPRLTALVKYADYHGVVGSPGRRKLWLQLEYKL